MKCENPVIYKKRGIKDNGKQDLRYIGHMSDFSNGYDKHFDDPAWCAINNYVVIPCGRCICCRLNYSKQWADRLILASENIKYKYFITLTYDDVAIEETKVRMYNDDDELVEGFSLVKDHVQRFLKRLRKYAIENNKIDGEHIQYYLAGEYGDLNGRPHYHIILFNFIFDDLESEYSKNGYNYYQSKVLTDLWTYGRTQVCDVTYETCAYVAGYVTKKVYGDKAQKYYSDKAIIPEFCTMSRRPAIGRDLYEKQKDKIYSNDSMLLLRGDKVFEIKPPRYYDKLFDIEDHTKMNDIKLARSFHRSYYHTDKYGYSYLQTCANNVKARQKNKKGEL